MDDAGSIKPKVSEIVFRQVRQLGLIGEFASNDLERKTGEMPTFEDPFPDQERIGEDNTSLRAICRQSTILALFFVCGALLVVAIGFYGTPAYAAHGPPARFRPLLES